MKKHFLCFMCLVFVVLAITSCLSKDSIERIVAQEFQEKMDTDSFFSKYDITVRRVVLLKKGINHYEGKIRILVGGASHSISVSVQTDGRDVIWEEDYTDYIGAIGPEVLKQLSGKLGF